MQQWEAYRLAFAYERAHPAEAPHARFMVVQLCDDRQRLTDRYAVEYWEEDASGWMLDDGRCYVHKSLPAQPTELLHHT